MTEKYKKIINCESHLLSILCIQKFKVNYIKFLYSLYQKNKEGSEKQKKKKIYEEPLYTIEACPHNCCQPNSKPNNVIAMIWIELTSYNLMNWYMNK